MIKISPKYGLNPSMTVCFWCGEPTGIALPGRITGGRCGDDMEAPKYMFSGYEPCDKCKESMDLGVTMMEAGRAPHFEGQPEMQDGVYPTGRWSVITKEAAERIFNYHGKAAFCDRETYEKLTGGCTNV